MWIEVQHFGGTSIEKACVEACALANRIDCQVHFKFNGVTCMARPGGDPDVLTENWYAASVSKVGHPMATCNPRSAESETVKP